jgi:opacity protein-like surface antigen
MQKFVLIAALLGLAVTGLASSAPVAQEPTYMQYARDHSTIYILGFGSAVPVGALSKFNLNVKNKAGATSLQPAQSDPGVAFNVALGYRLPTIPMHFSMSYTYASNQIDLNSKTLKLDNTYFDQNLFFINSFYDYAFTPHLVTSLGAGAGFACMNISQDDKSNVAQTHAQYSFAYQGVAKLSYRFTNLSIGLSERFIGTTMPLGKVADGASNAKVYNTITAFEIGCSVF